jgi:hypothetical protein
MDFTQEGLLDIFLHSENGRALIEKRISELMIPVKEHAEKRRAEIDEELSLYRAEKEMEIKEHVRRLEKRLIGL